MIKGLVRYVFFILDIIIPKSNKIIFNSYPDFSGNPFALFEYINKKEIDGLKIIWLVDNEFDFTKAPEAKAYKKNSIKGLYHYFNSRVVFYSHGLYDNIRSYNGEKRINLWHGMPIKKIGILDDKTIHTIQSQDYLISSSPEFSKIFNRAFGIPPEKILTLGQPQRDLLFEGSGYFSKKNIEKKSFSKVVVWLPTYRASIKGDIRIDGIAEKFHLPLLNKKNFISLGEEMKSNNILLLIKLHPMDALNKQQFENLSHLKIIYGAQLEEMGEQLYPLLGDSDAILTDYSSVYLDYLILNRPIGFVLDDFVEYQDSRGFLFDNLEEILPGEKISSFVQLITFINKIGLTDDKRDERTTINKRFNSFSDQHNSKRVFDVFVKPTLERK